MESYETEECISNSVMSQHAMTFRRSGRTIGFGSRLDRVKRAQSSPAYLFRVYAGKGALRTNTRRCRLVLCEQICLRHPYERMTAPHVVQCVVPNIRHAGTLGSAFTISVLHAWAAWHSSVENVCQLWIKSSHQITLIV